jgi:hypothetical protein
MQDLNLQTPFGITALKAVAFFVSPIPQNKSPDFSGLAQSLENPEGFISHGPDTATPHAISMNTGVANWIEKPS